MRYFTVGLCLFSLFSLLGCTPSTEEEVGPKYDYKYMQRVKEVFRVKNISPREVKVSQVGFLLPQKYTADQEVVVAVLPEDSNLFVDVFGRQVINVKFSGVKSKEEREVVVEYDLYYQPIEGEGGREDFTRPDVELQFYTEMINIDISSEGLDDPVLMHRKVTEYWKKDNKRSAELLGDGYYKNNQQAQNLLVVASLANILAENGFKPKLFSGWECGELLGCQTSPVKFWLTYSSLKGEQITLSSESAKNKDFTYRVVLQEFFSIDAAIEFVRNPTRLMGSGISAIE